MQGWIRLHRKMLDWEWYEDINTFKVFIHCLLSANTEDKEWRGILIKRGQFVSSIGNISEKNGLTVREVRTALKHLETTSEVTRSTTSKYTVFTINNYHIYQGGDKVSDNQTTNKRQSNDNQMTIKRQTNDKLTTTTKNKKNNKNNKNNKKDIYAREQYFDDEELNKTFLEFIDMRKSLKNGAMTDNAITHMINKLSKYDKSTSVDMLNKSIINNWKDIYPINNTSSKNQFNDFSQTKMDDKLDLLDKLFLDEINKKCKG